MFVFPVYPYSICFSKSMHSAALPGPAYPYVDHHRSFEFHPASWIPGPWCVETRKVRGDSQDIILSGHDTGMMIPHLSPIMDNVLLPLTLVSSSCGWPFVSFKKKSKDDKGFVGFFPVLAPFIYCDEPESEGTKDGNDGSQKKGGKNKGGKNSADKGKPPEVKKVSSDDLQKAQASQRRHQRINEWAVKPPPRLSDGLNRLPSTPGVRHVQSTLKDNRAKLAQFGDKVGIKVSGRGRVCIPTAMTIQLRFSFAELAIGWAKVLVSKAFDALAGAALKRIVPNRRDSLIRLDDDAAVRLANGMLDRGKLKDAFKAAGRLAPDIVRETIWKTAFEGFGKAWVYDGKFKASYGLFTYNFADGKGTFLWWGRFKRESASDEPVLDQRDSEQPDSEPFKGVRTMANDAITNCYQPAVAEITKDVPYAAGPDEAEPVQSTGSEKNPATDPSQPTQTDPSQPSVQPEPDYWTDPSQPSEQPEPDYWSDPSKPGNS